MFRSLSSILAAGLVLCLVGCATPDRTTAQSSDDHHIVRLAPAGQAGSALAHPHRIEADAMAAFLAALEYEEGGRLLSGGHQPVFSEVEINSLAPGLSEALTSARSDQRVDFVSFGHIGMGIGNMRKTEGTVFVDDQRELNIAFAGIRQLMTVDDDFTRFRDFSFGDPLASDRALTRLNVEDSVFVAKRRGDGSSWPMWVKAGIETTPARAGTRDLAPIASPATDPEPAQTATSASPASQAALPEMPDDLPTSREAIRDRLAFLKTLYDDGLISAEDYQREREKVLRQLP